MAGKFQYRLQKVLNMRVKREDNLKLELADVKRIEQAEKDALDELKGREQAAQKGMNQQLEAGRTADVQMSNDYLSSLKEKIAAQEKRWKAAADKVAEVDATYRKAQRDVEVVKKHRDKSKERWMAEEKRLEGIRSDEMAANMFQAKQRKRLDEEAEEAEYAERQALAEAMLQESSWMQGFLETAHAEASRINNEWGHQAG
jgi:flagellar FliJ protein